MAEARFDPGGFYEFDVARGAVRARDGSRVVVLSDTVVSALVSAAADRGDQSALTQLGRTLGGLARSSLARDPGGSTPEMVLAHASAVLALFGFGRLGLERWGDALVARLDDGLALDRGGQAAAALVSGLLSALSGRELSAVPAEGDRFLLLDPATAAQIGRGPMTDIATLVARLRGGS